MGERNFYIDRDGKYNPEDIEVYLSHYFGHKFFDLINDNVKPQKYKDIRKICLYFLYKYTKLKVWDIQRQYNQKGFTPRTIRQIAKSGNHDFGFLDKIFEEGISEIK
jgi:hypothetical protein